MAARWAKVSWQTAPSNARDTVRASTSRPAPSRALPAVKPVRTYPVEVDGEDIKVEVE